MNINTAGGSHYESLNIIFILKNIININKLITYFVAGREVYIYGLNGADLK